MFADRNRVTPSAGAPAGSRSVASGPTGTQAPFGPADDVGFALRPADLDDVVEELKRQKELGRHQPEHPDQNPGVPAHLQAIHRHLFGQIYDWASQLRTVNMTKGDTVFAARTVVLNRQWRRGRERARALAFAFRNC